MRLLDDDVVGRPHKLIQVNFQEINPVSFFFGVFRALSEHCIWEISHNHFNKKHCDGRHGFEWETLHSMFAFQNISTKPRTKHRKEEHACLQLQFHPILLEIEQLEVSETSLPKQPIG